MVGKLDLVAVGRAYTDLVAEVSPAFFQKYNIPLDSGLALSVEQLQAMQNELVSPKLLAGGSAANTVSIVAALGGTAGFFGKVYNDQTGNFFLEDFKRRGVEMCCAPYSDEDGMSALCLVLTTSTGQRSFAYNSGCADRFLKKEFQQFDFNRADHFLIDAYLLIGSPATPVIVEAIGCAKGKTKIVINLQDIPSWNEHRGMASLIFDQADIIIGNEAEQEAFARALKAAFKPEQIIITTKGDRGAQAIFQNMHFNVNAEKPASMMDSVGAGDAFTGGFLKGLSRKMDIENSLKLATKTATAILCEVGGRPTKSLAHLVPT